MIFSKCSNYTHNFRIIYPCLEIISPFREIYALSHKLYACSYNYISVHTNYRALLTRSIPDPINYLSVSRNISRNFYYYMIFPKFQKNVDFFHFPIFPFLFFTGCFSTGSNPPLPSSPPTVVPHASVLLLAVGLPRLPRRAKTVGMEPVGPGQGGGEGGLRVQRE